ncbi:hypothetical protein [Chlorogloea sp. CCALA 695]|uniref:hypothetical protein n=1 Tax=Chlorogloea sp. CCALA 695 TaxID=2107693 RepID=UPI0018EA5095|nr:hypothetical protein [Chlorogloea sp. CCALA 695]
MQNTYNARVTSIGFCFYKATNGAKSSGRKPPPRELCIKRHLAVDTLGFPFFTHCTSANLSDDAGLLFDVDALCATTSSPNL